MIPKIVSGATIVGGLILDAVGVSAHQTPGTQARIADVRGGLLSASARLRGRSDV